MGDWRQFVLITTYEPCAACGENTHVGVENALEQERIMVCPACTAEVASLKAERDGNEQRADLHARINRAVAGALGLLDHEDCLPSWHDMGERVAALVAERDRMKTSLSAIIMRVSSANDDTTPTSAILAGIDGVARAALDKGGRDE